jgi:hypothetical protein
VIVVGVAKLRPGAKIKVGEAAANAAAASPAAGGAAKESASASNAKPKS